MHRVFCAAPGELAEEHDAFYSVMAKFNKEKAMPRGVLFVSVSILPTVIDKRAYGGVVAENIKACRYYVQLVEDSWGPPEKNFERDHALAVRCAADPAFPMHEVAVFFKKPLLPHKVEQSVTDLKGTLASTGAATEFETIGDFSARLFDLLTKWLETVPVETAA